MPKIKSYVKVKSLAEAYELNQKKTARIIGGIGSFWMKMGDRAVSTAIDLSGLGLDTIMENDGGICHRMYDIPLRGSGNK